MTDNGAALWQKTEVMHLAWKFKDGIPLTVQISDRIRQDILRGEYRAGEAFPTVRQLAAEASVNPNTVQKALVILENEGLLVTLGTAGRTVTEDGEKNQKIMAENRNFLFSRVPFCGTIKSAF